MKIVQIITRFIVGGAQRLVLETAAKLRADGIDAMIWSGPQTGPEGSLASEATARGIPFLIIPDLRKEVDPLHDLLALRCLTRTLRNVKPDLVHTHSSKAGILGRRAARAAGVPRVVHTIHGWGFSARTPVLARAAFVGAERRAARWCDRLIAVSDAVREDGLAHRIGRRDQYRVIRPGIEIGPFRDLELLRRRGATLREELKIPPDAFVAGTIGRLSPQKNPAMILDAAARDAGTHWLLVGDGPLRPEIEERIRGQGLEGRVHLAGLRTDTAACYGALDLFVLTSLWEGLPLALMEAGAAALPVVAANVGGVAEILPPSPAGWTFRAGDVAGLAEAVSSVRGALVPAQRAALEFREHALRAYRLERMHDEIRELYENLLGGSLGMEGTGISPSPQ